jgi:hypothetical protein
LLEDTFLDRWLTLMRRVERAAFVTPTKVEVAIRDRIDQNRLWQASLELKGTNWKLTEVGMSSVRGREGHLALRAR